MTRQQSAMRLSGGILFAIGILFALTVLPVMRFPAHLFLSVAHWPFHAVPSDLPVPSPLLLVIIGGLTAGLGAMQWALGTYVAPLSATAAAKVAKLATWVWFCTDSAGSLAAGAPVNVLLNLTFLVLVLLTSRPQPAGKLAET